MAESGALTSLTDKGVLPTKPVRKEPRQWRRKTNGKHGEGGDFVWMIIAALKRSCMSLAKNSLCDAGGASPVCLTSVQGQIKFDAAFCCLSLSLSPPLSLSLSLTFFIFLSCSSYVLSPSLSRSLTLSLSYTQTHTHSLSLSESLCFSYDIWQSCECTYLLM